MLSNLFIKTTTTLFLNTYIFAIFFFYAPSLYAQPKGDTNNKSTIKTEIEKELYQQFENPEKVLWLKHYKGRFDDMSDIALMMAYDGEQLKGVLTYMRSKEEFRLEGTLDKDGKFQIQEFDLNNEYSGILKGEIKGKNIYSNWLNISKTVIFPMNFVEMLIEPKIVDNCSNNKWIHRYKGIMNNGEAELTLSKTNHGKLTGTCYAKGINKTYFLKGDLVDNNLSLVFRNSYGVKIGTLKGKLTSKNEIKAYYTSKVNSEGFSPLISLVLDDHIKMACIEYIDYNTAYDITYPHINDDNFDKWMNEMADDWVESTKYKMEKLKDSTFEKVPALRLALRAYAWCEVDYFDKDIISGFITFQNTWTMGVEGESFNYDLNNRKPIALDDIFENETEYKIILNNFIHKEVKKKNLYNKDINFRKWIDKEEFPYFTIHKDGLNFCSHSNSTYGRQYVNISYSDLRPFFKKDHPFKRLMD